MKCVLPLLAYFLNRKLDNLPLVKFKNDRRVSQGARGGSPTVREGVDLMDQRPALQRAQESRSRLLAERLSGELLGLTRGCDLRKEDVTVTSQEDNPNNRLSN